MINATPATQVLANVYQLYMVEYQCASMLINHNHGTVDITVRANQTKKIAAQTVLFQMYFFLSSKVCKPPLSIWRDSLRILIPSTLHNPMASIVQIVKNPILRKGVLPFRIA